MFGLDLQQIQSYQGLPACVHRPWLQAAHSIGPPTRTFSPERATSMILVRSPHCHSLEDGTFKSDYIRIGRGCTLGASAFVHYGVTIDDYAVLAPDSFLMKGEEVPQNAR